MTLAADERAAICDEFERVGPDRLTLCAGWTTHDLLAHLLLRERQPWAAPGIMIAVLAPITDLAMRSYATTPWAEMVGLLRAGAPLWSPWRIEAFDRLGNGAEFFVHHEDVRRGPGAAQAWEPRPVDPVRDAELWDVLLRMGRVLYRRSPVGVVLQRPSGARHVVTTGPGMVTIIGEPGELVLYAFGRDAVRIELDGAPADVAALTAGSRGI